MSAPIATPVVPLKPAGSSRPFDRQNRQPKHPVQLGLDGMGFPNTEYGNAERLVEQHGADLHYCNDLKKWYAWDGMRWKPDSSAEVVRMAKDSVRNIYRSAADIDDVEIRKATAGWARRSEKAAQIMAMIRLAESEKGIPIEPKDFDPNPWLLNCLNGTLDLRTGDLQPQSRANLLTKLAPVRYNSAAKHPRWKRFLSEVFSPHPDLVPFVQRAVGYSLTGDTREECLFLLNGSGRNGKGTFIKTLTMMLGDYAGTAAFSAFVPKREHGPCDDIANMKGKHFMASQESREGAAFAESIVKTMTGGDIINARRLYENALEIVPTWKIWLATNHLPRITGTDPGIWSRMKLIPFDVSFEGREDRALKSALEAELPGILAWAVEGCLRWIEDGLQFPKTVQQATATYRKESDHVGQFLDECCVIADSVRAKAGELYTGYRTWAEPSGEEVLSNMLFWRRLTERGIRKTHEATGNVYHGIGLRSKHS